jgi:hypothetical protein
LTEEEALDGAVRVVEDVGPVGLHAQNLACVGDEPAVGGVTMVNSW